MCRGERSRLQSRVSERAVRHTRNVPVLRGEDVGECLREDDRETVHVLRDRRTSAVDRCRRIRGSDASRRHRLDDRDVCQLAVVGRTARVVEPCNQGIRPQMVPSLIRNCIRPDVGQSPHEVVRAHRKTSRVLVQEVGVGNRVCTEAGRVGRVVGPVSLRGCVASCVAEQRDRVGQTEVETRRSRHILERSALDGLLLIDEHITRSITHLHTLIIVNDSIMGICLRIDERRSLSSLSVDSDLRIGTRSTGTRATRATDGKCATVEDDEVVELTEAVVDLDIIERQSGDWQSDTAVLREPEWKNCGTIGTVTERDTRADWGNHGSDLTDHVAVTDTLGSTKTELIVEIHPERIKLHHNKLIECDIDLAEQIVHEIVRPTDGSICESAGNDSTRCSPQRDNGDLCTEPNIEDIVPTAIYARRSVCLTKVKETLAPELNRNIGEPVGLLHTTDKPSDRIRTTIQEAFLFREGGKIDECAGRCRR